jgi:DNA-binding MarR family transcriptional regulator
MDYELLTDLITAFKEYQLSQPEGDSHSLLDFSLWVTRREYQKQGRFTEEEVEVRVEHSLEIEISKLIVYMSRYARLLVKKGLKDFPELINEDFIYLYMLMTVESMTKVQLIEQNVHEKPTGMEILKRLLKHGLIGERADAVDKRSKRVFLTEKGRRLFFQTVGQMEAVSKQISGALTPLEKEQLFSLLKKLEDFHQPLFLAERGRRVVEE